jgi:NAD+ synthase
MEEIERKLLGFIRKQVETAGANGVVVGMSGGIDSSVVAALCAKAIGPEKVLGLCLPDEVTSPSDVKHAEDLAKRLGIKFKVIEITPVIEALRKCLPGVDPGARVPLANLKARTRMIVLYYYANLCGYLVAGTGNRSELRTGYFTKWGDGAADFLPLGSLYKTQVKELARHLGIPRPILDKTPTAGLWPGQTDEGELGISYEKLDKIYMYLDAGKTPPEVAGAAGVELKQVMEFIEREKRTQHKRLPPPSPT